MNYQCRRIRSLPARYIFCGGDVCSRGHGNLRLDSNLLGAVKSHAPVEANCCLVALVMGRKKESAGGVGGFGSILVEKATTIKGGLTPKACQLPILEVQIGIETMEFVHIHRRCEWLCKMVTGEAPHNRPLTRVKLIDKLLHKVRRRWVEQENSSGSDDDLIVAEPIDDPMASLAFDGEQDTVVANKKKEAKKKNSDEKKNTIMRVRMPQEPPELNPNCKSTYEICLLLQGARSLWLLTKHLPWAIGYMHKQWKHGGVDAIEDEPEPDESPVKSKSIKWDFQHECWVATVISERTTTEKRLKPSDSEVRSAWRANQGKESTVMEGETEGSALGYEVMKTAAYEILENWVREQN